MMKTLRLFAVIVMLCCGAGCATCRQPSGNRAADSSGRTESKEGWGEWIFDQAVRNFLGNLIGRTF